MKSIPPSLFVFFGGGCGAVLRYAVGTLFVAGIGFPWATFIINAVGSFLIGLLAISIFDDAYVWRLLLMTGLLGGFTTFSAFSLETASLWQNGAQSTALIYIGATLVCCLAAVALGLVMGKAITA